MGFRIAVVSLILILWTAQTMARPCQNITVTLTDFVFTPNTVDVEIGDTLSFVWAQGAHDVVQSDSSGSCNMSAVSLFNSGAVVGVPNVYDVPISTAFTLDQSYFYFCTPHCGLGMRGNFSVTGTCDDVTNMDNNTMANMTSMTNATTVVTTTPCMPVNGPNVNAPFCNFECNPSVPFIEFQVSYAAVISDFDCNLQMGTLAEDMEILFIQLHLINAVTGSVVLTLGLRQSSNPLTPAESLDRYAEKVRSGNAFAPNLQWITDSNGNVVSASNNDLNTILFVIFATLIVVVILIIIILCCCMARNKQQGTPKAQQDYHMSSMSRSEYASFDDDPLTPKPGQKNVIPQYSAQPHSYKLLYTVQDTGAQILQAKAGDILTILPDDRNVEGPWVWATMQSTGDTGYVPASYIGDPL